MHTQIRVCRRKFNKNEYATGVSENCLDFIAKDRWLFSKIRAIENPIQTTMMYKMLSTFMPAMIKCTADREPSHCCCRCCCCAICAGWNGHRCTFHIKETSRREIARLSAHSIYEPCIWSNCVLNRLDFGHVYTTAHEHFFFYILKYLAEAILCRKKILILYLEYVCIRFIISEPCRAIEIWISTLKAIVQSH